MSGTKRYYDSKAEKWRGSGRWGGTRVRGRGIDWNKLTRRTYNNYVYGEELALKNRIRTQPCSVCGWNKANCDVHRIIPAKRGGRYTEDNVKVLCPNCHRLEHRKVDRVV